MRARFVPLVLAAMLVGPAVAGHAQDRPASEEQRKALIESLFVDAAQFHEARDYEHELEALEGIVKAANVLNEFRRKDTAALERATNKVIALRSLAAQQVDTQVQVVRAVRAEIDRVTGQFASLVSSVGELDRMAPDKTISEMTFPVREAAAFARQQEFSGGRVGLLTELTRAGERVARVADQVCRAASRDEAAAAVPIIEADVRRVQEIEQLARRWVRLRSGEEAGSLVDRVFMVGVEFGVRSADAESSMLERSLADFEKYRGQSRQHLEQAIGTLRSRLVQLDQEQGKLEPLIAFYQRCGDVVRFGEDQTPRWRIDSANGTSRARSQVTALQKTLDAMSTWDAAASRDAAGRVRAESDRLVAEWNEVGKLVADTDAAAASALSTASEIRQRRDRATACVAGLGQRAASSPATPTVPAPAAVPPAPARDAHAVGGGTTPPPAQPAAAAAPTSGAPQPQAPPATTPPPIDPNVAGGIKIQGPTTRIGVGERVRFVATDYGNRVYTKVTWTSFDDELLSIDSQGRATGLRPGKLLIHAALDDERAATLSLEVVERPATPPPSTPVVPAAPAAPQVPPATPTSGFQVVTTQAGPDTSRPAADRPAPATAPPPVTEASGSGRPSTSLLGIDVQGTPTPPAAGGFGVGATTAGRDPAPPSPGGGGQPGGGGSGGQNPQRGTPPPGPGPQTRAVAGQPAAYHIFATGSRMGWASGLGQYSVGPADPTIIEHLQAAGEHIMWANRESYLPVTAWPNWPTNRAEVRSWADDLTRDPRNPTRRQITVRASSRAATLADELRYQTMGGPEHTATCDAAYMRLG